MNDIFRLSRRALLGAGTLALGAGLLPGLASAQSISTIKTPRQGADRYSG